MGVDIFIIATDEPGAAVKYGTPDQQFLSRLTLAQAQQYLDAGEFPAGSMGPKVRACMSFIRNGGGKAVITHLSDISAAVEGNAGTRVVS